MRTSRIAILIIILAGQMASAMALSINEHEGIFVNSVLFDTASDTPEVIDMFINAWPDSHGVAIPGVNCETDEGIPMNSEIALDDSSLPELLYFLADFQAPLTEQLISSQLLSGHQMLDETIIPEPAGMAVIGFVLLALKRRRK